MSRKNPIEVLIDLPCETSGASGYHASVVEFDVPPRSRAKLPRQQRSKCFISGHAQTKYNRRTWQHDSVGARGFGSTLYDFAMSAAIESALYERTFDKSAPAGAVRDPSNAGRRIIQNQAVQQGCSGPRVNSGSNCLCTNDHETNRQQAQQRQQNPIPPRQLGFLDALRIT